MSCCLEKSGGHLLSIWVFLYLFSLCSLSNFTYCMYISITCHVCFWIKYYFLTLSADKIECHKKIVLQCTQQLIELLFLIEVYELGRDGLWQVCIDLPEHLLIADTKSTRTGISCPGPLCVLFWVFWNIFVVNIL